MRLSSVFLTLILAIALLMAMNVEPHPKCGVWITTDRSNVYGGTGDDQANSVTQTSDGGFALAGRTTIVGASYPDFWLVKTNSFGDMEWNRTYGGPYSDIASSVIQTDDGGYALAGFTYCPGTDYDFWLIKTDSDGNHQWNKTYGGSRADLAYSMVRTNDGGYALAGYTSPSTGLADFWLVKTDSTGSSKWNRTYPLSDYDIAHFLISTNDGGYAVAGSARSSVAGTEDFWLIKTNSSGHAQWNMTYGGTKGDVAHSLVQSVDGGYTIVGETQSFGAGGYDFWLVKTDSSGNSKWNRTYGGSGSDVPRFMLQTSCGGYAIAGYTNSFSGSFDFWLIKTDVLGMAQWDKTFGGAGNERAFSAVLTSDGGYALAGHTYPPAPGSSDFWLVKLAPSSIYIHADGSIDPPTAPMVRDRDVYMLTEDVYASAPNGIVIERDDAVLDGAGYLLQGTGHNTGILVHGRDNVTIRNMSIEGFALGINISTSLDSVIRANSIRDCEIGIGLLSSSNGNTISENIIAAIKGYGIRIESSSNNLLTGNSVRDNYGGIRLLQCTNVAYHNNFVNNTLQVSAIDSLNVWDDGYPSGGNYWSDYAGVDVDGDGIGNTPHIADAGNQDNNPLMTPYPYYSGDINRDGIVNQLDLHTLDISYSSTPTSTNWSSDADLNNDRIIDVQDLRILGKNFGKTTKQ